MDKYHPGLVTILSSIIHPNLHAIAAFVVVVGVGGSGGGNVVVAEVVVFVVGGGGVIVVGGVVLVDDCLTKGSYLVCPQLASPKIDLDKQQQ